jgi:hypothetical protein
MMASDFKLELRGGPHNGNRPVITAESEDLNSFPVYYTYEGQRYERTMFTTHGGERIYVYLYPESSEELNEQ